MNLEIIILRSQPQKDHRLYDSIYMKFSQNRQSIETESKLVIIRNEGGGEYWEVQGSFWMMKLFWN